MDRHLKERLVGAAVLAAAAIILIPEMLTGPHDASPPTAPEKAAPDGMKTYTIDLNAQKERAEPPQAPAQIPIQTPEIAPAPQPEKESAPQSADTPPPRAEQSQHSTNVAVQPVPQMAPPAQSAERAPVRAAERGESKPAQPKPELPKPAPPAASSAAQASTSAASGGWAVQVASFGQRATSERIADDLKSKGFSAYVMSVAVKDQTMYRVRVGPVRDREAAEALLQKVKQLHPNAAVVTQ